MSNPALIVGPGQGLTPRIVDNGGAVRRRETHVGNELGKALLERMRLFLAETANQVRLNDRISASINHVVDMGFLRRLRGTNDRFEVRRILKAFVDAQWLADLDQRLAAYQSHSSSEQAAVE